jgi:hypothetical protein
MHEREDTTMAKDDSINIIALKHTIKKCAYELVKDANIAKLEYLFKLLQVVINVLYVHSIFVKV